MLDVVCGNFGVLSVATPVVGTGVCIGAVAGYPGGESGNRATFFVGALAEAPDCGDAERGGGTRG